MKVNPIVRPIVRSIVNPIVNNIVGSFDDYYQYYDGVAGTGSFAVPITFPGNYSVSVNVWTSSTANQVVLGDQHTTAYYFNLSRSAKIIVCWCAGAEYSFSYGSAALFDDAKHNIKYELTGTNLEVFLDNVSLGSQTITPYTGANDFVLGGSQSNPSSFTGYLSDLVIDNNGVISTYPLKSNTIEYPLEHVIGDELVTGVASNVGSQWTYNGDNNYTLVGDGSYNRLGFDGLTTIGDIFAVTFTIDSISGGSLKSWTDAGDIYSYTSSGVYTYTSVGSTSGVSFARNSGSVNCTISNISIRKTSNYLIFTGVILKALPTYYQSYNGTSSFGVLATPKVFTGDFTVSIDFATTETAVTQILIGDNDSSDHFISLQADGEVRASINGTLATSSGIIDPRDGNLNNLTLQRVGGVFDLRLNNNSVASGNEAGDFIVSATGVYNTNLLPLKGTLANLILVDDADGDELVTTYDDGYINTSSDNLTLAGGAPYRTTEWLPVEEGETYNIQRTNSTRRVWQYSTDSLTTATWGGQSIDDSFVAPAGATHIRVYYGHSSDVNPEISVRQVMSETLTFPLVESDIEYPLERDTTEHMPNGDFVTDDLTGWTPSNATQSVVNNSLELVDVGGSAHTIHLLLVPHADTDYDISIDIKAAAGNTNPRAASVELGGTVYRVTSEDTIETITATVSSTNFGYIEIKCATWGGSNGDTAYFSDISVQKASNYLTFTDVTLIELP